MPPCSRLNLCDRVNYRIEQQLGGGASDPAKKATTKYDNGLQGYYDTLPQNFRDYLSKLFYGKLKASGGQRFLYEQMLVDVDKPMPHPSWRQVRAWASAQRVNALSRPLKAKSKSVARRISVDMLKPMRVLGADSIVMQGSGANERKMADQGYSGIVNIVDFATKRSFPSAVRKVGGAGECGQAFVTMIRRVRQEFYADPDSDEWPVPKMLITHDSGPEFGQSWKTIVRDELSGIVDITFSANQANNPNSGGGPVTENSNKQIRNILRRIAQANRLTNENDTRQKKPWQSYWYGRQGVIFKQMQQLVNERMDNSLGRLKPIDVWNAYMNAWKQRANMGTAAYKTAQAIVNKSQQALIGDADKRRGPSRLKPENYFKKGQIVRRENSHYAKASVRSNISKQGNRFSLSTYKIYSRQIFPNAPPIYELTVHSGKKPSDFKTRQAPDGTEVGTVKYPHDQLILVIGDEEAPQDLMEGQLPLPAISAGERIRVEWIRVRKANTQTDDWELNEPARLQTWLSDKRLTAIRDGSEEWFEGDVAAVRQLAGGTLVDIDFDDGSQRSINITNEASSKYLEEGKWEVI